MAEAMLIPGATQVFADVLEGKNGARGSGDVKKLFKNMELGKYTLQDIVKVLDTLDSRVDPELLAKSLKGAAPALRGLSTAWQRTLVQLNEAGFFDMMIFGLTKLTDQLLKLTAYISENKEEIKEWANRIIGVFEFMIDNLPLVIGYWASFKLAAWMTTATAGTVALATALRTLLLRFLIMPVLIGLAGLALLELVDTFNGEATLLWNAAIDKDKGILGWIAVVTTSILDLVKLITSSAVLSAFQLVGYATGNKELVSFAKERFTEVVADNNKRQKQMLEGTSLEGLQSWKETLAPISQPKIGQTNAEKYPETGSPHLTITKKLTQEQLQSAAPNATSPKFGAGSPMDLPEQGRAPTGAFATMFAPTINITGVVNDPKVIANVVTTEVNNLLMKTASNYSPTPSLNN